MKTIKKLINNKFKRNKKFQKNKNYEYLNY